MRKIRSLVVAMALAAAPIAFPAAAGALPFDDPELVSSSGYDADLAVAPDGAAVIAWTDQRDSDDYYRVDARLYATDGSAGEPIELDANAGQSRPNPTVALGPDGTATVLWTVHQGNKIEGAQIATDGAVTPLEPIELDEGIEASSLRTIAEASGAVAVIWQEFSLTDFDAPGRITTVQLGADRTWGALHDVFDGAGPRQETLNPHLLPASDGGATAVWSQRDADETEDARLRAARLSPDGSLGDSHVLEEHIGDAYGDDITATGSRVFFASGQYENKDGHEVKLRMVTIDEDARAVGEAEVVDSVTRPDGGFYDLDSVTDEAGLTTVVWADRQRGGYKHRRGQIGAVRVLEDGTVDRVGPVSRKDRSRIWDPAVTVAPGGRAEVVWMREKRGDERKLGAAKLGAGGRVTRRQRFAGDDIQFEIEDLEAEADATGRVRISFWTWGHAGPARGLEGLISYVSK